VRVVPERPDQTGVVEDVADPLGFLDGQAISLFGDDQIIGPRYYQLSARRYAYRPSTGEVIAFREPSSGVPVPDGEIPVSNVMSGLAGPVVQQTTLDSMLRSEREAVEHLGAQDGLAFKLEMARAFPWREGAIFGAGRQDDGGWRLKFFKPLSGDLDDLGPLTDPETAFFRLQAFRNQAGDPRELSRVRQRAGSGLGSLPGGIGRQHLFRFHAHHPTRSTRIWQYHVAEGKLRDLGAFDELAGMTASNRIPNMMHGFPIEMDGRVYFIGQDPFYGKRSFPALPPDTAYAGSSIHGFLPAVTKGFLYLKEGYKTKAWYGLDVRDMEACDGIAKFRYAVAAFVAGQRQGHWLRAMV
jgi:hypothetical protein